MNRMDPIIKARWVAALRSGAYQQGQKRLRSRDGTSMCCLGVLCDVLEPNRWEEYHTHGLAHRLCVDTPADEIRTLAGFPNDGDGYSPSIPSVDIGGERMTLWQHNDNGRTFAEIADAIEAQL